MLIDGYNIIFAWDELKELAKDSLEAARMKLVERISAYKNFKQCEIIVVFDAYRVKGHDTEILDYHNIHVVYTKEAETADRYIEKFAHEHGRKYDVTVATSDGLEQIIILGQGCHLMSAREFEKEVAYASKQIQEEYLDKQKEHKQYAVAEAIKRAGFKETEYYLQIKKVGVIIVCVKYVGENLHDKKANDNLYNMDFLDGFDILAVGTTGYCFCRAVNEYRKTNL